MHHRRDNHQNHRVCDRFEPVDPLPVLDSADRFGACPDTRLVCLKEMDHSSTDVWSVGDPVSSRQSDWLASLGWLCTAPFSTGGVASERGRKQHTRKCCLPLPLAYIPTRARARFTTRRSLRVVQSRIWLRTRSRAWAGRSPPSLRSTVQAVVELAAMIEEHVRPRECSISITRR